MATAEVSNVIPMRRQPAPQDEPTVTEQAQGYATTEPRPGEQYLCAWIAGLFSDAQQGRDRAMQTRLWETNEQAYWGMHWPETLPSYKSPIVINELKRLILHELSDLTDMMPTVYVSADPS